MPRLFLWWVEISSSWQSCLTITMPYFNYPKNKWVDAIFQSSWNPSYLGVSLDVMGFYNKHSCAVPWSIIFVILHTFLSTCCKVKQPGIPAAIQLSCGKVAKFIFIRSFHNLETWIFKSKNEYILVYLAHNLVCTFKFYKLSLYCRLLIKLLIYIAWETESKGFQYTEIIVFEALTMSLLDCSTLYPTLVV